MSVEFQLGHQDHDKVEDFLARTSSGVGGISLHPKFAARQLGAAAVARDAGLDVLYDPRTESLASPGLTLSGLPGYTGVPYDLGSLSRSIEERQLLVDAVLSAHPELTTVVTPPHFLSETIGQLTSTWHELSYNVNMSSRYVNRKDLLMRRRCAARSAPARSTGAASLVG